MKPTNTLLTVLVALAVTPLLAHRRAELPKSPKLYVFDCGSLDSDPSRYQLKRDEVATDKLSVACFLVAHPNGTLMWDTGAVPDTAWKPVGTPVRHHLLLSDGQERYVTVLKPLRAQLIEAGYSPADVTYLA